MSDENNISTDAISSSLNHQSKTATSVSQTDIDGAKQQPSAVPPQAGGVTAQAQASQQPSAVPPQAGGVPAQAQANPQPRAIPPQAGGVPAQAQTSQQPSAVPPQAGSVPAQAQASPQVTVNPPQVGGAPTQAQASPQVSVTPPQVGGAPIQAQASITPPQTAEIHDPTQNSRAVDTQNQEALPSSPFEVSSQRNDDIAGQVVDTDKDINTNNDNEDFLGTLPAQYRNKNFFIGGAFILFLIGLVLGALLFGGGEEAPPPVGLQGVVVNSEVPAGRPRCGMVEYGQGCVLYIINAQRKEITAKELYNMAAQMTKIPVYIIETGNLRYNNTMIKPGYIAQINIQPMR